MGDPRPICHRLIVPKGWEGHPDVALAYGRLVQRYGKEHVELIVEEPARVPDRAADELPDLSRHRVFRVAPDPDE